MGNQWIRICSNCAKNVIYKRSGDFHCANRKKVYVFKAAKALKGKILGCYCAPQRCHADIIAEYANS